jgi:hypothetical protein
VLLESLDHVVVETRALHEDRHRGDGVFVEDIRYNEMAHHTSVFETDCGACGKPVGIKDPSIPPSWKHVIIPDD